MKLSALLNADQRNQAISPPLTPNEYNFHNPTLTIGSDDSAIQTCASVPGGSPITLLLSQNSPRSPRSKTTKIPIAADVNLLLEPPGNSTPQLGTGITRSPQPVSQAPLYTANPLLLPQGYVGQRTSPAAAEAQCATFIRGRKHAPLKSPRAITLGGRTAATRETQQPPFLSSRGIYTAEPGSRPSLGMPPMLVPAGTTQQPYTSLPDSLFRGSQHEQNPHTRLMPISIGLEEMLIEVDVQAASKMAYEKRLRNAGASARFRERRKQKEKEASQNIQKLETQLRDLERRLRDAEHDKAFYMSERDRFREFCFRNPMTREFASNAPPSPRISRQAAFPPPPAGPATEGRTSQDVKRPAIHTHGPFQTPFKRQLAILAPHVERSKKKARHTHNSGCHLTGVCLALSPG
jgi:hypothetical protein